MAEGLDLSVPDTGGGTHKPRGGGGITTALLVLLVLLAGASVFLQLRGARVARPSGTGPAAQEKKLALKLEERDLHGAAIDAWSRYLVAGGLGDDERAKIYWRLGNLYAKADRYEEAIDAYYRCEAAYPLDDVKDELGRRVKRCLEELGRFSAVGRELAERTSGEDPRAQEVVAEIGSQKITLADLEGEIEREADAALQASPYAAGEERAQIRSRMLKEMSTTEAKMRMLNRMVIEEVLYRKAMEEGLARSDDFRRLLSQLEKRMLAGKVIEREMEKEIKIGRTDLRTYYDAHLSEYVEPEGAELAHILVRTEAEAKSVIERVRSGTAFENLAKDLSLDEETKKEGGRIPGNAREDGYIPVVGEAEKASDLIFAAEEGSVLTAPLETKKGFHVVKVLKRIPERQKPFGEVASEVARALYGLKQQEVQAKLFAALKEKYDVALHPSRLETVKAGESKEIK